VPSGLAFARSYVGGAIAGWAIWRRWRGSAGLAIWNLTSLVGLWFVVRRELLGIRFGPVDGSDETMLRRRYLGFFTLAFVCLSVICHVAVRLVVALG